MTNTTSRVAAFFCTLVLLQASCAVSRYVNVPAVMTVNGFEQGEGGGGPAACDGSRYHSDQDFIVSLSTRWYAGGERCGKLIRITITNSSNLHMSAIVVDECGNCDDEVGASPAVWHNFGLDTNLVQVSSLHKELEEAKESMRGLEKELKQPWRPPVRVQTHLQWLGLNNYVRRLPPGRRG